MDHIDRQREAGKFPFRNETFYEFQQRRRGGSLVERIALIICTVVVIGAGMSLLVDAIMA